MMTKRGSARKVDFRCASHYGDLWTLAKQVHIAEPVVKSQPCVYCGTRTLRPAEASGEVFCTSNHAYRHRTGRKVLKRYRLCEVDRALLAGKG